MRVCLVSPYDLTREGGVQAQVRGLAGWLRRRGDQVRMVAPALAGGEEGAAVGRVRLIRANRSVAPISLSAGVPARMASTIRWAEVMHVHEPLMPRVGWAALGFPVPRVVTFHADPPAWVRGLYRGLGSRVRSLTGPGTMVTAVSRQAAAALPVPWGPERIIPNGVDAPAGAGEVERRRGEVVFLGRDEPRKGLDVLLKAWPGIRRRHPGARLAVMGASRPEAPDGVVFLGRVSEEVKERTLRSAEVYVAPNLGGESFGIVLVEAMTAGCALVASDLRSFRDVAGRAARFFPAGDAGRLVESVDEILADPARSEQLSAAGRERARRFSWDRVGAAYRECYEQVMARRR